MAPYHEYARIAVTEKDVAEVTEPFLVSEDGECTACTRCAASRRQRRPWRSVLVHIGVAALYMAALGAVYTGYILPQHQRSHEMQNPHEYAPAKEALTYGEAHFETSYENNPYAGEPRPEHEAAWYELLKDPMISIPGDEMTSMNITSLQLKNGEYVVQLGVFHQLHCVKWMRQWMHREHYWPHLNSVMLEERRRHIDHCLEMFRFHFMCHPDLTLGTFKWIGSYPTPGLEHHARCANWDSLRAWTGPRQFNILDLDIFADRPPREGWEPSDLDLILGIKQGAPGEQEKYTKELLAAEPPLLAALHHQHLSEPDGKATF